ncbi:diaminopimelate decarboxylase [Leifsonia lichenia]
MADRAGVAGLEGFAAIAAEFGTPVWVYDAASIRSRIAALRSFDTIRFAQKACSNIHILSLMREEGVQVDAVSAGELERARRAGYPMGTAAAEDPVVFTADLLDRPTLERVVRDRVTVNCGSPQMLEQLGQASPGHRVWIRVNPGFGHGHSRKTNTGGAFSKHGIWHEELADSLAIVDRHGLELAGLHMHIGSGADFAHLARVADAMVELVIASGRDLPAISAGGGLPVPYADDERELDTDEYFRLWDAARGRLAAHLGHPVRLEIEPGRFLVASSGVLVAEVRAFKRVGANRFVLVDAGFNDLMRPALYGAAHRVTMVGPDGVERGTQTGTTQTGTTETGTTETVLAGPLCESGDVFTQAEGGEVLTIPLPAVEVGDLVVFRDAGAYGASMSSTYNSRPLAPEVLVDGGAVRLIRRRQTIDDLLELESFA